MKRAVFFLATAILLLLVNGPAAPRMKIGEKIYPFPYIDALVIENDYPGDVRLELKDAKDYAKFKRALEWDGWEKIYEWDDSWNDGFGFADYFGGFFTNGDMGIGVDYSYVDGYPPPSIQMSIINNRIHLSAEEERNKAEAKTLIEEHTGKQLLSIFTNDPDGAFWQMGMTSYSVLRAGDDFYNNYNISAWSYLIYDGQVFDLNPTDLGSEHAVFDVDRDGKSEFLAIVDSGRYFSGVFKDNGIQFYAYKIMDDPENPGKKTLEQAYHSHWDHPNKNDEEGYQWFYGFDTSDPSGVRLYEGKWVAGELMKTQDLGVIRLDGKRLESEYFTDTLYEPAYDGE